MGLYLVFENESHELKFLVENEILYPVNKPLGLLAFGSIWGSFFEKIIGDPATVKSGSEKLVGVDGASDDDIDSSLAMLVLTSFEKA